eukprot:sb/3463046/
MVSKSTSQSKNLVVIGRTPSQGDSTLAPESKVEKSGDIASSIRDFTETTSGAQPSIEEGKDGSKPRGRSRGRPKKEDGSKGKKVEKSATVNGKKRRPGRPRNSSTEAGKQGGRRKGRSSVRRKSVSSESKVSSAGETASITTSDSEEVNKGEEVYCHICNKNLTGTTIARQERHINNCCDEQLQGNVAPVPVAAVPVALPVKTPHTKTPVKTPPEPQKGKQGRGDGGVCHICAKVLAGSLQRHLKSCAKKNGWNYEKVLENHKKAVAESKPLKSIEKRKEAASKAQNKISEKVTAEPSQEITPTPALVASKFGEKFRSHTWTLGATSSPITRTNILSSPPTAAPKSPEKPASLPLPDKIAEVATSIQKRLSEVIRSPQNSFSGQEVESLEPVGTDDEVESDTEIVEQFTPPAINLDLTSEESSEAVSVEKSPLPPLTRPLQSPAKSPSSIPMEQPMSVLSGPFPSDEGEQLGNPPGTSDLEVSFDHSQGGEKQEGKENENTHEGSDEQEARVQQEEAEGVKEQNKTDITTEISMGDITTHCDEFPPLSPSPGSPCIPLKADDQSPPPSPPNSPGDSHIKEMMVTCASPGPSAISPVGASVPSPLHNRDDSNIDLFEDQGKN